MNSRTDKTNETPQMTECGEQKTKIGKIKITVGVIVAAAVVISAAAAALVNRPEHDDVVILTPSANSSVSESTQTIVTARTTKAKVTKVTTTSKKVTSAKTKITSSATSEETSPEYSFPADINTASKEMLMAVDGIGEVTADRMISYRDSVGVIYNMDMLLEINGIGEHTLELLKNYFYVDSADYRDMPDNNTDDEREAETSEQTVTYTERQTHTTTATVTTEKLRQKVNINTADAEEIADKLIIDIDKAEAIVALRDMISYYESPNELLLCEGFTEKLVSELWDYIEV